MKRLILLLCLLLIFGQAGAATKITQSHETSWYVNGTPYAVKTDAIAAAKAAALANPGVTEQLWPPPYDYVAQSDNPPPPPPGLTWLTGFQVLTPNMTGFPPAVGGSITDVPTGATSIRLADAKALGAPGNTLKAMYSQFPIDSYNHAYTFWEDTNGNVWLRTTATGAIKPLMDASGHAITENRSPRWDYSGSAPTTLYYTDMTRKLYAQDVATGKETVVHDFSDLIAKYAPANGIFMDGHADTDNGSRYFPIQILCFDPSGGSWYPLAFAVYDRQTDKVIGVIDSTSVPAGTDDMKNKPPHPLGDIHSAPFTIDRSGKYAIVQWQRPNDGWNANLENTTRDGAHAYAFSASGIDVAGGKRINPDGPTHGVSLIGSDGHSYWVDQNNETDWFEAVDLAVGIPPRAQDSNPSASQSIKIVNMGTLGWDVQVHFSAPRQPGNFVGMFFDAATNNGVGGNQFFVFSLKAGANPLRLGPSWHTNPGKGQSGDNYDDQNYGTFAQDGSAIYYASNGGDDSASRDPYMLPLPSGWQAHIP